MTNFTDRHRKRLNEEKKTNVYFLQMQNDQGARHYFYVVASALLHEQFGKALELNQIPDFAVVVQQGSGVPTDEVKQKMLDFYGFDHEAYDKKVAENMRKTHSHLE